MKKPHPTDNERWKGLTEYILMTRDPKHMSKTRKSKIQELCKRFDREERYFKDLFKKMEDEGDISRKAGGGRPTTMTEEVVRELEFWAAARDYEFSFDDIAHDLEALSVSRSTVARYVKDNWKTFRVKVKPILTRKHREKRLKWARGARRDQRPSKGSSRRDTWRRCGRG